MKTKLTPLKSIRRKCINCSVGSLAEVRLCPVEQCFLWYYRMGKRPINSPQSDRITLPVNIETHTKVKENLKHSAQMEKLC